MSIVNSTLSAFLLITIFSCANAQIEQVEEIPKDSITLIFEDDKGIGIELYLVDKRSLNCGANIIQARVKNLKNENLILSCSGNVSLSLLDKSSRKYLFKIDCPTERCIIYISEKNPETNKTRSIGKIDLKTTLGNQED